MSEQEQPRNQQRRNQPQSDEVPSIGDAAAEVAVSLVRLGAALMQLPAAILPPEQREEFRQSARDMAQAATHVAQSVGDALENVVEDLGRVRETGTSTAREDLGSRLRREQREAEREQRRAERQQRRTERAQQRAEQPASTAASEPPPFNPTVSASEEQQATKATQDDVQDALE
jgi:PAB1-binding protein PBP1